MQELDHDASDRSVECFKRFMLLTSLTKLSLMSCDITGEAVSAIPIGDCPHLRELILDYNNCRDPDGAFKALQRIHAEVSIDECHFETDDGDILW
jgi:hypothetical protein